MTAPVLAFAATPLVWIEVRGPAELVGELHRWCSDERLFAREPAGFYGPAAAGPLRIDPSQRVLRRGFAPDDAERVVAWLREHGAEPTT